MSVRRSKATSQIQLTSRPSCVLSLRQAAKTNGSLRCVRKLSTWLQPAGFLIKIMRTSVPPISNFSMRPKPQAKRDSACAAFESSSPMAFAAAMAAQAL